MTDEQRDTLMLEIHKLIETSAEQAVLTVLARQRGGSLIYPPGTRGLSAADQAALQGVQASPEAVAAGRRVVADAVASAVFDLLCLLDGAREPEGYDIRWTPFQVVPAPDGTAGRLHEDFRQSYAEWRRRRPDPGWTLD